jgi:predicted phage terminase large subunit-like protein
MTTRDEQVYWAAVRSDLKTFLRQAFRQTYSGKEFMDNWHIDAIIYALIQGYEGKMPRLIINLPPRHLKSFIISVVWPAFILGRDPTAKIICVSYSDELGKTLARDFRRIIESEWYRKVFPEVRMTKMTEGEAVTTLGGFRYSISVGGSLTGRGGDFIIIDDPIKPDDALSDKARQTNNEWFKSTLLSRLEDKQRSVLILVMQRLHVNDLTGFIEGNGFKKLSFPAIAYKDEEISIGEDSLYSRQEGEALHHERESLEILERIRNEVGPHNFTAQYQQRPEAPEGALFKRKYLQFIDQLPDLNADGYLWISIDSALSTAETADYSAITVGYSDHRDAPLHHIIHAERGRWDYESLLKKAQAYAVKYPEVQFIVEAAGSGISLVQSLQKRGYRVISHRARGDKISRAARALPIFEEKRVVIVRRDGLDTWVEPLVNELLSFPFGRFDDQVDSVVQGIRWAEGFVNSGNNVILC